MRRHSLTFQSEPVLHESVRNVSSADEKDESVAMVQTGNVETGERGETNGNAFKKKNISWKDRAQLEGSPATRARSRKREEAMEGTRGGVEKERVEKENCEKESAATSDSQRLTPILHRKTESEETSRRKRETRQEILQEKSQMPPRKDRKDPFFSNLAMEYFDKRPSLKMETRAATQIQQAYRARRKQDELELQQEQTIVIQTAEDTNGLEPKDGFSQTPQNQIELIDDVSQTPKKYFRVSSRFGTSQNQLASLFVLFLCCCVSSGPTGSWVTLEPLLGKQHVFGSTEKWVNLLRELQLSNCPNLRFLVAKINQNQPKAPKINV